MSMLYINDDGAKISLEANRIKIAYRDGLVRSLPIESVESIILLGNRATGVKAYRGNSSRRCTGV